MGNPNKSENYALVNVGFPVVIWAKKDEKQIIFSVYLRGKTHLNISPAIIHLKAAIAIFQTCCGNL